MFKRVFLGLTLGALLLTASSSVQAQGRHDQERHEQWNHRNWDNWSHSHRDLALEIQTHPDRLRDHDYMSRHHDLQIYVQQDPGVVQYYSSNPYPLIVEGHHTGQWHRHHDGTWGY